MLNLSLSDSGHFNQTALHNHTHLVFATKPPSKNLNQPHSDSHATQLFRHGERSPVSQRFTNAGLHPYWPYCSSAYRQTSPIITNISKTDSAADTTWSSLHWQRRLETFGPQNQPIIATGPNGEFDNICQPGELTDKGRASTLALGQRLRTLYIQQLNFMPDKLSSSDAIYLRSTPRQRTLESVQQVFCGLYPTANREPGIPPPTIVTRAPAEETLNPNEANCRRFAQISKAFCRRTCERWNHSREMSYLTEKIGKWMPETSPRVQVDGKPRLIGIFDTINATLAHGPETRLPTEFYDPKLLKIIDMIGLEEWYSGYSESREFRALGIGSLMGDIVKRMTQSVERMKEVGRENDSLGKGRDDEQGTKMSLSGCHDTTLAAVLCSLGAFEGEKWPPFTSHLAIELFRTKRKHSAELQIVPPKTSKVNDGKDGDEENRQSRWWSLFGQTKDLVSDGIPGSDGIGRKAIDELGSEEKQKLNGYLVRIRYNDKVMKVPGCKQDGKHLEGDDSFCTLVCPFIRLMK